MTGERRRFGFGQALRGCFRVWLRLGKAVLTVTCFSFVMLLDGVCYDMFFRHLYLFGVSIFGNDVFMIFHTYFHYLFLYFCLFLFFIFQT